MKIYPIPCNEVLLKGKGAVSYVTGQVRLGLSVAQIC